MIASSISGVRAARCALKEMSGLCAETLKLKAVSRENPPPSHRHQSRNGQVTTPTLRAGDRKSLSTWCAQSPTPSPHSGVRGRRCRSSAPVPIARAARLAPLMACRGSRGDRELKPPCVSAPSATRLSCLPRSSSLDHEPYKHRGREHP